MIYNNIEFHNVAELENISGMNGFRLQRFPQKVRNALGNLEHEKGRFFSQVSVGCEIRFVTDSRFIRVSLSTLEGDGTVYVYKGNFIHSSHKLKSGVITTLHLEEPSKWREVMPNSLEGNAFSSNVWRLMFGIGCCAIFHHIDTFGHEIRTPEKEEIPRLKWLAYGSSITFGEGTTFYPNAYVQQAARRLNADVLNKGIAASCFCEKVISKYIAENNDWDIATLELGVNMRGRFTLEEYEQRVRELISGIIAENPNKPIIVIGIYPNGSLYSLDKYNKIAKDNVIFNEITKEKVNEINNENIYFLEGGDILTDYSGLSTDLLHPSDHGHINMGENLYYKLKKIIESCDI